MAKKQVVCGTFGTIYYATILNNGLMSNQRVNITDDAIVAVMEHMLTKMRVQEPFTGVYSVEINGYKLTLDATQNADFVEEQRNKKESNE